MSEPGQESLLEALRGDREAPAPEASRMRVAARLGLDAGISTSAPRPAASHAGLASTHMAAMVTAAFVAGAGAGALLYARWAPVPAPRTVYVDRNVPAPAVATVPASSTTTAPSAAAAPTASSRVTPPPSLPASSVASSARDMAQLDVERAILDAARAALVAGDSDEALRVLDRHARTYARPLLGEERDALFIQALARAGRAEEARSRADAFRRKNPESLFLPAVESAITSLR